MPPPESVSSPGLAGLITYQRTYKEKSFREFAADFTLTGKIPNEFGPRLFGERIPPLRVKFVNLAVWNVHEFETTPCNYRHCDTCRCFVICPCDKDRYICPDQVARHFLIYTTLDMKRKPKKAWHLGVLLVSEHSQHWLYPLEQFLRSIQERPRLAGKRPLAGQDASNLCLFNHLKSIVDLDAKVANCAFQGRCRPTF